MFSPANGFAASQSCPFDRYTEITERMLCNKPFSEPFAAQCEFGTFWDYDSETDGDIDTFTDFTDLKVGEGCVKEVQIQDTQDETQDETQVQVGREETQIQPKVDQEETQVQSQVDQEEAQVQVQLQMDQEKVQIQVQPQMDQEEIQVQIQPEIDREEEVQVQVQVDQGNPTVQSVLETLVSGRNALVRKSVNKLYSDMKQSITNCNAKRKREAAFGDHL